MLSLTVILVICCHDRRGVTGHPRGVGDRPWLERRAVRSQYSATEARSEPSLNRRTPARPTYTQPSRSPSQSAMICLCDKRRSGEFLQLPWKLGHKVDARVFIGMDA